MRHALIALAFAFLGCRGACAANAKSSDLPKPPPELASKVTLELYMKGLSQPVGMVVPPGEKDGRIFFVEKTGTIRIVRDAKADATPFIDLTKEVSQGSEQGMLGLAFHPDFATNGRFFVDYTDTKGDTRLVEYRVSEANPNVADPATRRELLHLPQPFANHNGGHIVMGPDRLLYVGTGDGGAANDPKNFAQNDEALLGKMLRIDVDAKEPKPEIVAKGLRNPWRFSFDRATQDLYIADVGQNRYEWVHDVPKGTLAKKNFGWKILEGSHCLEGDTCDRTGLELPEVEYSHRDGCCITGGAVYRGKQLPELQGHYFYGDFCTDLIRSFRWQDGKVVAHYDWAPLLNKPERKMNLTAAFGEDADGELYVLSLSGEVYRFARR